MNMIFILFLLLLLLMSSTPVAIAIYLTGFILILIKTQIPIEFVGQIIVSGVDSFSLLAVLFFIVAGNLVSKGTIVTGLVNFAKGFVGYLKGGLAITAVFSCGMFGAVSGSNVATLAAIGNMMIPSMKKEGYGNDFVTGLLTSSSILGVIIPPSIPMIIYCSVTDSSVGELFIAGIGPGVLIIFLFSLFCYFYAKIFNIPRLKFSGVKEILGTFKKGIGGLMVPIIIFGGIYSGVFTPTEASVVATVYAYIAELFIFRELSLKETMRITIDACTMTGVIMFIVIGAQVFGSYISLDQVPVSVTEIITKNVGSKFSFLILVGFLIIFIGMFMELVAALLIITPILIPSAAKFGIDPIQFGMILILGLAIGFLTPPVGLNLYVASAMTGLPIKRVVIATLPFVLVLFIAFALVCGFPDISLYLPNLLMK